MVYELHLSKADIYTNTHKYAMIVRPDKKSKNYILQETSRDRFQIQRSKLFERKEQRFVYSANSNRESIGKAILKSDKID